MCLCVHTPYPPLWSKRQGRRWFAKAPLCVYEWSLRSASEKMTGCNFLQVEGPLVGLNFFSVSRWFSTKLVYQCNDSVLNSFIQKWNSGRLEDRSHVPKYHVPTAYVTTTSSTEMPSPVILKNKTIAHTVFSNLSSFKKKALAAEKKLGIRNKKGQTDLNWPLCRVISF